MPAIPTVEIVNPDAPSGFTRINKADFDPATMQIVGTEGQENAPGLTREEIDAMQKGDVRDLLDMHGVEHDGRANVGDLRDLAKHAIFVDF